MCMWVEMEAQYGCVTTCAWEEDMPGALAPLHVNEGMGRLAHKSYTGREKGVMLLTSQAGLLPVSCQRITTWGGDWKGDGKVTLEG